jgi:hypothetical protein
MAAERKRRVRGVIIIEPERGGKQRKEGQAFLHGELMVIEPVSSHPSEWLDEIRLAVLGERIERGRAEAEEHRLQEVTRRRVGEYSAPTLIFRNKTDEATVIRSLGVGT